MERDTRGAPLVNRDVPDRCLCPGRRSFHGRPGQLHLRRLPGKRGTIRSPPGRRSERAAGALIDRLAGKRRTIVGPDTILTLSIAGRTFINDDGKKNLPGGEIFTGPVEDSANGTIRYSYPAIYGGKEVADIRLRFEEGRVVEARAGRNEELLQSLLAMDDGAKRLGEFAFGTNPGITRFTRNASLTRRSPGRSTWRSARSYPTTGGQNQSAMHWEMVCDLRDGGGVWVDGKLFARDGRFNRVKRSCGSVEDRQRYPKERCESARCHGARCPPGQRVSAKATRYLARVREISRRSESCVHFLQSRHFPVIPRRGSPRSARYNLEIGVEGSRHLARWRGQRLLTSMTFRADHCYVATEWRTTEAEVLVLFTMWH